MIIPLIGTITATKCILACLFVLFLAVIAYEFYNSFFRKAK